MQMEREDLADARTEALFDSRRWERASIYLGHIPDSGPSSVSCLYNLFTILLSSLTLYSPLLPNWIGCVRSLHFIFIHDQTIPTLKFPFENTGSAGRIRTYDQFVNSELLYH